MKKIIAILLILTVFTTTMFAAPLPVLTGSQSSPTLTDDLFADVQATELTQEEAEAVEGGIPPVIIIVAVIVIAAAAVAGLHGCNINPVSPGP